jgi:hypothetical protein
MYHASLALLLTGSPTDVDGASVGAVIALAIPSLVEQIRADTPSVMSIQIRLLRMTCSPGPMLVLSSPVMNHFDLGQSIE